MIWAEGKEGLIGRDGKLPWHYPKDIEWFNHFTKDKSVIMGENTYHSLKKYYKDNKLPFGKTYVATLEENLKFYDALPVYDIEKFYENLEEDIIVVGGKTIYELSFPYATDLFITLVPESPQEGDVCLDKPDLTEFMLQTVGNLDSGKPDDDSTLLILVYKRANHILKDNDYNLYMDFIKRQTK